jgi:lipopolysaccharide transport system permease protein
LISHLWTSRRLVATLTRRQLQVRYRQSFAGYFWAMAPPLGMLAVGALVFGRVAGVDSGSEPYSVVTMAALVPWNIFANSVSTGVPVVYASSNLVTRMSFPRAALPLASIATSMVSLALTMAIFLVIAFAFGNGLPWTSVWFPLILALELVFVAGVVLLGSALDVFARDVRLAIPIAVQLWLLVTPVMYPLRAVPQEIKSWYLLNPMTGFVETFRRILVSGQNPDLEHLLPAIAGAVVLFVVGAWYFSATENRFADVV